VTTDRWFSMAFDNPKFGKNWGDAQKDLNHHENLDHLNLSTPQPRCHGLFQQEKPCLLAEVIVLVADINYLVTCCNYISSKLRDVCEFSMQIASVSHLASLHLSQIWPPWFESCWLDQTESTCGASAANWAWTCEGRSESWMETCNEPLNRHDIRF